MSDFTGSKAAKDEREKRRPGRPMKEGAVKRTDKRVNIYVKREIYDFWSDRNEKTGEPITATINRLLFEEMERIKLNAIR